MKATRARSDIKSLSTNWLISQLEQRKPAVSIPIFLKTNRIVLELLNMLIDRFQAFAQIKQFIVKLLGSWVMLKNDISCHMRYADLGKNHFYRRFRTCE